MMKAFLILALLVGTGIAQPGHKTLLVSNSHTGLEVILAELIPNGYETASSVPTNLSDFHTILIDLRALDRTALDDRLDLLEFLKSGGQLYLEGGPPDPIVDRDTDRAFWDSIGVYRMLYTASEFYCDSAYGVEMFSGFSVAEPFTLQLVGYGGPEGDIDPVLYLCNQAQAWVPHNRSLKVLLQYFPQGPNYYPSFMRLALCSYFDLCPAAVPSGASDAIGFAVRLVMKPVGNTGVLQLTGPGSTSVVAELFDVLGSRIRTLGRTHLAESHLALPIDLDGLVAGTYYARVEFGTGVAKTVKLVKN